MTPDDTRLIEVDFPLERVSLDSVHEKNVRHGHISTLHIWPARRPLAACRAALIATLLPDPGNAAERREVWHRLAGEVVETVKTERRDGRTVEKRRRETRGGILHWGRESGGDLEWFREKIGEAYGGRAPRVLDPFAGGGAIPLEAMRLGCEATAVDINPVAWFILKCTLDYPHRLAGKTVRLPDFALADREFMEPFLKAKGLKGKTLRSQLAALGLDDEHAEPELLDSGLHDNDLLRANLAWQLRAWGRSVLARVRAALASRYPTYAEFQPLATDSAAFERKPLALLTPDDAGETDVGPLNARFSAEYLRDPRNPRWVTKPTVAYLWARTVRCKGCRATLPLLKTRWLAKTNRKRVLLTLTPKEDGTGVDFGIEVDVPGAGGNAAQRREHDKRLGVGTMSRSGARCPCCPTIMGLEDIQVEGRAGRMDATMIVVVVNGLRGKEYRPAQAEELVAACVSEEDLDALYSGIPFGMPNEAICAERPSPNSRGASGLPRYGILSWKETFADRQLLALGTFIRQMRGLPERMVAFPDDWRDAIVACLALTISRLADRGSALATWTNDPEQIRGTFARFALPIAWDFSESCPLVDTTSGFVQAVEWIARVVEHLGEAVMRSPPAATLQQSATDPVADGFDLICTDPPYYDAIPYSDLMDFFHVWLRRTLRNVVGDADSVFVNPLGPKWDRHANHGELVDQPNRFAGDKAASKQSYEDGMARAFRACHNALNEDGRLVVVFANKSPDAWETLAGALIRAGFVVGGSWPIQTERVNKLAGGARLASSVWLVCRKRPPGRPGWESAVLADMRENITRRLRDFWDAGIRGPDFVWSATGPALEAFSRHPSVKKADEPGAVMTVSDFLREVRRMVVDFVVGRVLTVEGDAEATNGLDDVTTYYLLHRGDFGLGEAPAGACILYALSCNLSDRALSDRFEILSRPNRTLFDDLDGEETAGDEDAEAGASGGGGKVKLLPWNRRKAKWLGYEGSGGHPVPLIDRAHRLMHLWRAGDEAKVNGYLDDHGLGRHALFARVLQALIELSAAGSDERAILESLSNHIAARAGLGRPPQRALGLETPP